MPSLSAGAEWMAGKLRDTAVAGISVVYRRGGATVTVSATSGATQFVQDDGEAVIGRLRTRDYFINVADLLLESIAIVPEEGDTITETINGTDVEFEVTGEAGALPFMFSDFGRTQYRIHTKEVG